MTAHARPALITTAPANPEGIGSGWYVRWSRDGEFVRFRVLDIGEGAVAVEMIGLGSRRPVHGPVFRPLELTGTTADAVLPALRRVLHATPDAQRLAVGWSDMLTAERAATERLHARATS